MDNRGVSEIIGFVLVVGLIIGTISLVTVAGVGSLDDARKGEQLNNAERAFDVLASNFQTIARENGPNRATEIKLSEAQLETSDTRRIATNTTSFSGTQSANPVSIRYRAGTDTEIVYEAGAVIRTEREGGIMLQEPDFVFDEDRTVIRYIEPRGAGQVVGGTTTVLVHGEVRQSRLLAAETDLGSNEEVTFNITTTPQRAEIWQQYLEGEIDWKADACGIAGGDDDIVTCTFPMNEGGSLHVARTRIAVTLG